MQIYLWSPLYPNYEARLEAMARAAASWMELDDCLLSLVPR